ncbi:unnamed protein product [Cunninghamella echinulata]
MSLIEAKKLLDRVDYEKCYITNPNGELYFKSSEANDIKTKLEEDITFFKSIILAKFNIFLY